MKCGACTHFKDVKNPVYGWCSLYKMDVHPEWDFECPNFLRCGGDGVRA